MLALQFKVIIKKSYFNDFNIHHFFLSKFAKNYFIH